MALAVQVLFNGSWCHAEALDDDVDEFTTRRILRAYRDEHGVPTRIIRMGTGYETNWGAAGRSDRGDSVLAIPSTKSCGDLRRGHVLHLRGRSNAGP